MEQINKKNNDPLNYLFKSLFANLYHIVFIFLTLILIFLSYYNFSPKTYEVKSLIQIESSNRAMSSLDSLLTPANNISLDEQILIFKSKSKMLKIIKDLNLNVLINNEPVNYSGRKITVSDNNFNYFDSNLIEDSVNLTTYYIKKNNGGYDIFNSDDQLVSSNPFGESIELLGIKINIDESFQNKEDNIRIDILSPELALEAFIENSLSLKKLRPDDFFHISSLLEISHISYNIKLSKDIINLSNKNFIESALLSDSKKAKMSLSFIDSQIANILDDLKIKENLINDYRSENISVDIELESVAILEEYKNLNAVISSLKLELANARVLYKKGNILIQKLEIQLEELNQQERLLNKKISALPEKQQQFIELNRDIDVSRDILSALQEKKIEFSLKEASTIENVKIIDDAYYSSKISPKGITALMGFLLFGIILSIIYSLIRTKYFLSITYPDEIIENHPGLNLLSVFFHSKEKSIDSIIDINKEAIGILASKIIKNNKENAEKIVVCGPSPGIGKTTTSIMIAESLAKMNKRVLLIDGDYKRGDLHKNFRINAKRNLDFLRLNSLPNEYKAKDNLYLIPRPRNSSSESLSIIESEDYSNFLTNMSKEFDYIIFDTPPILAVSDSLFLALFADKLILCAMHNRTKLGELSSCLDLIKSINKEFHGFVYNSYKKSTSSYYYQYYSYYDYRYTYKEDE